MEIEIWAIMITDSIKRELKLFRIPYIHTREHRNPRAMHFLYLCKQTKEKVNNKTWGWSTMGWLDDLNRQALRLPPALLSRMNRDEPSHESKRRENVPKRQSASECRTWNGTPADKAPPTRPSKQDTEGQLESRYTSILSVRSQTGVNSCPLR